MRCKACDARLTAREATLKGENTGEYMDLCSLCLSTIADWIGMTASPLNADESEISEENDGGDTEFPL